VNRPDTPSPSLAFTLTRLGAGFLGVALLFSLWASPDRRASLPWFILTMVGLAMVLASTDRRASGVARRVRADHLLWLFLAIGFVTLAVTIFTTRWPAYKLSWLNDVYAALPSIRSLPWWWVKAGLHPNQTGAMLALSTAFATVVATAPSMRGAHRWPAIFLALSGFIGVFMTGSRAALAGLVVAVLVVAVVRTSRWLWAYGTGVLLLALGLLASGQLARIVHFFLRDETLDTKLVARLDIWASTLTGIQDHFFTGIGLGVFNQVMPVRYPYQTVGLSYHVSQAHNLLLDTALAVGVPGLVGFLLLLAGALLLAVRGAQQDGLTRLVSLGILASAIVYLVFGITDSISFSLPTSFIIWIWICGLAIFAQHLTHTDTLPKERRQ
jgi:O-antigen ligase